MLRQTHTTILGVVTVAALLLTGCAGADSGGSDAKAASAPAATATDAPAATAPVAYITGEFVDAATAAEVEDAHAQLMDDAALVEAGLAARAYALDDGNFIIVHKAEPLPDVVRADLDVKASAVLQPVRDATVPGNDQAKALSEVEDAILQRTGKVAVIAWEVNGVSGVDPLAFWAIRGKTVTESDFVDLNEALTWIETWLAGANEPEEIAVIVVLAA